jgi:hypothetical protein
MDTRRSYKFWTVREEKVLREMWVTAVPIKEFLHMLSPDRTYQSVIAHAQNIRLGARPIKVRSTYSGVWAEVERVLKTGKQLTANELAERTGHCARNITDLLHARHELEEPLVHVATWRRCGAAYRYVEVWGWGEGPDAVKPKARTLDEINRLRRARRAARNAIANSGQFGAAVMQLMQEAA